VTRLDDKFASLRGRETALVAYLTAGDPSLDETAELVVAAAEAGADVIELGVPWSDPSADGPVIERAMGRALAKIGHGVLPRVLDCVAAIRRRSDVPLVLFGYFNPLLQRGLPRIAAEAASAGVDGFLVVDLPPEESGELDDALAAHQLSRIPLLAPTTTPARAATIVARGGGFAYYVGLTGVTGAGHLDAADVARRTAALRPSVPLPLAVGFGVKDAVGAAGLRPLADGVVVGTAIVRAIEEARDPSDRRTRVTALVSSLKSALR
jgi:tryptophan synthase alpha chain